MTLYEIDLTTFLQAILAVAGAALIALGVRRQVQGLSRSWQTNRSLRNALRGFRMMVIGIGLLGAAAGWHYDITWLLVFSLAFAGEETWESSLMLGALPHAEKRERGSNRAPGRWEIPAGSLH